MIQFFIKVANNWIGKVIFAAILFGMVFVWGYGGLSQTAKSLDYALKVGNKTLSIKQLDELFSQERQRISMLMGGQYISPKTAIEMGILDQVVQTQMQQMIFDTVKDDLGLTASNAAVRKYVEINPAFADATGHFDRNMFMAYLRQTKMGEQELAHKLQEELASQHLSRALQSIAYTPTEMVKADYKYKNEKRDVTILEVTADKVKLDKGPTEAELKDYYEIYAEDRFSVPEYRSFRYLLLTPDILTANIEVSEDEIDDVYEERKAQYETPEKRLVRQMFFKDKEAADKTSKTLTASQFDVVVEKLGQDKSVTDFGYVAQNELMEELADPVFKAKKGDLVGPVESMTGWHILLVKDIKASSKTPIMEVRSEIKKQLAREKAYLGMDDAVRQIEDILGSGENLNQVSKVLNVSLKKVKALDIAGLDVNGNKVSDISGNTEFLQNLFTLKVGESTPLFETAKGILVAELDEIIPVSIKSFESVKSDLTQMRNEAQRLEKLPEIASQIMNRVQGGASLQTQGVFGNFNVIKEKQLTRAGNNSIPAPIAADIFKEAEGVIVQIPLDNRVLIAVTNHVIVPDITQDKVGFEKSKLELKDAVGLELVDDVLKSYANSLNVRVNTEAIKRAFSVYTNEQE